MATRKLKPVDFFIRVAFAVSLAIFGYSSELLFQSYVRESPNSQFVVNEGHEKYILIGGSISLGLGSPIETHLREITRRDDLDVIEMSDFMMTIGEAMSRAERAVGVYRPKAVILMVGMNEADVDNEWMLKAHQLLETGAPDAFSHHVFAQLDRNDFASPLAFFHLNRNSLRDHACRVAFENDLRSHLGELAGNASHDAGTRHKFLQLVRLALALPNSSEPAVSDKSWDTPLGYRKRLTTLFEKLRAWVPEGRVKSFRQFVGEEIGQDTALKAWFWFTWRRERADNDEDPVRYYARHIDDLSVVANIPLSVRRLETFGSLFPEEDLGKVAQALLDRAHRAAGHFGANAPLAEPTTDFDFHGYGDVDDLRARGVRVVLLHYPGVRLPGIDELGRRFRVPVIGGDSKISELVRSGERSDYFFDRVGDSGHLTTKGLDVFGRDVAEDLVRLGL